MSFAPLAERLTRRAAALASSRAENHLRARRRGGTQWRRAALLWPLFPKGDQ